MGFSSIDQSGTSYYHTHSERRLSVPFHIQLGVQSDVGTPEVRGINEKLLLTPSYRSMCIFILGMFLEIHIIPQIRFAIQILTFGWNYTF